MSKRGDNIHKRKDGRWEGRYIKYRNECGKAFYASVYGKSYSEVKSKLEDIKHGTKNNSKKDDIAFSFVIDQWLSVNKTRIKGSTYSKYLYMIDTHIRPFLGERKVNTINAFDINSFIAEKLRNGRLDGGGGLSSSYVKTLTLLLNSTMNYAANEGYCNRLENPVISPPVEKKQPNVLSEKDFNKLINYTICNLDLTSLGILISLTAGLRIGEICALKWKDINFEKNFICVNSTVSRVKSENNSNTKSQLILVPPKTSASNRIIPICSTLYAELELMYPERKSTFVISNENGFVNPRTYDYRFHKVLEEAGVNDTNYHTLRHTFATRCAEKGMDIKSLSEILGHGNTDITLGTYIHPSMAHKQKQIELLLS